MLATLDPEQVPSEAVGFFRHSEVPESWAWVDDLSPLHLRLFAVELADAVKAATISGESTELVQLVREWQATAELDAAPEVVEEVRRPKERRPLSHFTA